MLNSYISILTRPWASLGIPELKGNLDVLHISHMWLIKEGVDYAVEQLHQRNLPAAQRLQLARTYGIDHWLDAAIRDLLLIPLKITIRDHMPQIGIETLGALACAKEAITDNQRKVSVSLIYPKSFDDAPYCSTPEKCKETWFVVWIREICRLVHSHIKYVPLADVMDHFRTLPFGGMHTHCKNFVIDSLCTSNAGLALEEQLIQDAIREIGRL